MLPFVFWTQGHIPFYGSAIVLAVALAFVTLIGGYFWVVRGEAVALAP